MTSKACEVIHVFLKPGSLSQVSSANSGCPSRDATVAGEWEVGLGRNSCLKSRPCHRFLSCWPDVAVQGSPSQGSRLSWRLFLLRAVYREQQVFKDLRSRSSSPLSRLRATTIDSQEVMTLDGLTAWRQFVALL